ncbi:hypothetical protein [Streptomyces sp. KL116D]|uniref:hypothetical protein n=1 Tax=Streptomyces sp. KL116D TaxID=3045152 RepID=UPI003556F92C
MFAVFAFIVKRFRIFVRRFTTRVHLRPLGRKTESSRGHRDRHPARKWVYDTISGAKGQLSPNPPAYIPAGNAYTNKVTAYDNLYRRPRRPPVIASEERSRRHLSDRRHHHKPSGADRQLKTYSAAGACPARAPAATAGKTLRLTHSVYGPGA